MNKIRSQGAFYIPWTRWKRRRGRALGRESRIGGTPRRCAVVPVLKSRRRTIPRPPHSQPLQKKTVSSICPESRKPNPPHSFPSQPRKKLTASNAVAAVVYFQGDAASARYNSVGILSVEAVSVTRDAQMVPSSEKNKTAERVRQKSKNATSHCQSTVQSQINICRISAGPRESSFFQNIQDHELGKRSRCRQSSMYIVHLHQQLIFVCSFPYFYLLVIICTATPLLAVLLHLLPLHSSLHVAFAVSICLHVSPIRAYARRAAVKKLYTSISPDQG